MLPLRGLRSKQYQLSFSIGFLGVCKHHGSHAVRQRRQLEGAARGGAAVGARAADLRHPELAVGLRAAASPAGSCNHRHGYGRGRLLRGDAQLHGSVGLNNHHRLLALLLGLLLRWGGRWGGHGGGHHGALCMGGQWNEGSSGSAL